MKRIKQIIEALKVISRTPSTTIDKAWTEVYEYCTSPNVEARPSVESVTLLNNIMEAVCGFAEDMEKPAKV